MTEEELLNLLNETTILNSLRPNSSPYLIKTLFVDSQGKISHPVHYPCHAGAQAKLKQEHTYTFTKSLNVVEDEKEREVLYRYYNWLINESIVSEAFVIKNLDYNVAIGNLMDNTIDGPPWLWAQQLYRLPFCEQRIPVWKPLVKVAHVVGVDNFFKFSPFLWLRLLDSSKLSVEIDSETKESHLMFMTAEPSGMAPLTLSATFQGHLPCGNLGVGKEAIAYQFSDNKEFRGVRERNTPFNIYKNWGGSADFSLKFQEKKYCTLHRTEGKIRIYNSRFISGNKFLESNSALAYVPILPSEILTAYTKELENKNKSKKESGASRFKYINPAELVSMLSSEGLALK